MRSHINNIVCQEVLEKVANGLDDLRNGRYKVHFSNQTLKTSWPDFKTKNDCTDHLQE
jgi:hypothetical protein